MKRAASIWAASIWAVSIWVVAVPAVAAPLSRPPNVLLVTVDTLRPDALGWVDPERTTPAVDALAEGGFRFPAAVSPAPLTLPAHASLMSALVPPRHGVRDNGQIVPAGVPLLAERFATAGYETAAFVSGYPVSRPFGLARGFTHYDDELPSGSGAWLERTARATVDAAVSHLAGGTGPWFVWVHFYDPHLPYEVPGATASDSRDAYFEEVVAVDRELGRLLAAARTERPLLTVFTADHGESLGEHGEESHGYFVYDATIRVPLIFHYPEVVPAGASDRPARLVDVAPSILELAGLEPLGTGEDSELDGVSLVALLDGGEPELPPAYFETYQPWYSFGWSPLRGAIEGGWKWIAAPEPELYRVDVDPDESDNVYAQYPARGRAIHRSVRQVLAAGTRATLVAGDPTAVAKLRALGYLGAGVKAVEPPATGLRDPKSTLELRASLTRGQKALDADDAASALARFDEVLAVEPENRFALSRSGMALLRLGELEGAIGRLRAALTEGPDQAETRALLAEALGYAGDHRAAVGEWMEVVRLQPAVAVFWSNLGAALGRTGEGERAIAALAEAARLEPESGERLSRLAFAEYSAGRLARAAEHLEAAAALSPEGFRHAAALGVILIRLERPEQARPWLARATPVEADFGRARLELARVEARAGRLSEARVALGEALAQVPALRREVAADALLRPLIEP